MSTPAPWLVPDPDYLPTSHVGDETPIDAVLEIKEIVYQPDRLGHFYRVEIVNELRDILGEPGRRVYQLDTIKLDTKFGTWDGLPAGEHRPDYKVGDQVTFPISFRIESTQPDPNRENAYIYGLRMAFAQTDTLPEILGDEVATACYPVLAKGVDEYIAALPV